MKKKNASSTNPITDHRSPITAITDPSGVERIAHQPLCQVRAKPSTQHRIFTVTSLVASTTSRWKNETESAEAQA
jgi:hypothetical protein